MPQRQCWKILSYINENFSIQYSQPKSAFCLFLIKYIFVPN